jgi:hypothetical protein
LRTFQSGMSNAVEFTMLDESGRNILTARDFLPAEAPELCSAEFRSSGDRRLSVDRGGSLVCYFRSPARAIEPVDVTVEAACWTAQAHTISPLGDGVWQANVLLEQPLLAGSPVRIRLGLGEWSSISQACEIS